MALKDKLGDDLRDAMRSGDAVRRDTLRLLLTAVNNVEVARVNPKDASSSRQELADADVLDVVQKQVKQRRDSVDEYRKAKREDLATREEAEMAILAEYLPAQLSRDEVLAEVRKVIDETGASGPQDKGKVMPQVMALLKGKAEGRVINEIVTELLGAKS